MCVWCECVCGVFFVCVCGVCGVVGGGGGVGVGVGGKKCIQKVLQCTLKGDQL